MSYTLLAKKLLLEKERFIDSKKIKAYCAVLKLNYYSAIGYLLSEGYLVRILRGIFYIKTIEERKTAVSSVTYLEAIKKAFEIKGINHWYFGLESALKLNNLTHETFLVDYVISDKFRNHRPITILGHSVRFISVKIKKFGFGIKKGDIPYSDTERTVLDMIYLFKQKGTPDERINDLMADYLDKCGRKKTEGYLKHYPKTMAKFIQEYHERK